MENLGAFKTNRKYYISLTEASEGGWDYSVYDWRGELVDGGQLDEDVDIYTAVEEITELFPELFGQEPDIAEIDYEALQNFVS